MLVLLLLCSHSPGLLLFEKKKKEKLLYQSIWGVITKCQVVYKQQKFTSHSSGDRETKITVLKDLTSGEHQLSKPNLFSLTSYGGGGNGALQSLLSRHKSHSRGLCPHDLITFQKPHLQILLTLYLGLRLNIGIWGDATVRSKELTFLFFFFTFCISRPLQCPNQD